MEAFFHAQTYKKCRAFDYAYYKHHTSSPPILWRVLLRILRVCLFKTQRNVAKFSKITMAITQRLTLSSCNRKRNVSIAGIVHYFQRFIEIAKRRESTAIRYKDAASSKQHDEDCERILVELSCFWKPRLQGPNDIINLNYFPIDKCMTYDKYTETQESMHGKEAMYGIFTENEEQIAGRSRSVNDPSDGSKDVHISIKGLANSTKTNPLLSATSQSNMHGDDNDTKIQNATISAEIEESISQHLKACKKNVFVKNCRTILFSARIVQCRRSYYGFSDSSFDDSGCMGR